MPRADPLKRLRTYVGHKGWIGLRLDIKLDWDEVADIVADG